MTSQPGPATSAFIDHGSETYTFLQDPVIDALMQVVVELGAQAWITRRRLLVLERVLAERRLIKGDVVETYQPSEAEDALWRAERDRLMKTVYAALIPRPLDGDAAAERAKGPNAPRRSPLAPMRSAQPPPTGG